MSSPTRKDMIDHLREHYGLTVSEVMDFVNIPLHPNTIRDDFAAKAMLGILTNWNHSAEGGIVFKPDSVAKRAYTMADAMLKERIN